MPKTKLGLKYIVHESSRAKRVIIQVLTSTDVEVVIPNGFPRKHLPELLDEQAEWVSTQQKKFQTLKKALRPKRIPLTAIGQTWTVQYVQRP